MDFSTLSELYSKLENESSGNKLREILAEFFLSTNKEEPTLLPTLTYLSLGKIAPDYKNSVLGIAEKLLLKAIAKAANKGSKETMTLMQKDGDVGLVAQKLLKVKPMTLVPVAKLTVEELWKTLHKIKSISGNKSQDTKEKILISLFQKTTGSEAKYLARIILQNMRLGVADMTVLDALAIAFTGEKSNKKILERAYNVCPDLAVIASSLVELGLEGIGDIPIKVGRPIRVMLAQRVASLSGVSEKISGELQVEAKYDGERIQIHKDSSGKITLYSRRMEDITYQYPDVQSFLKQEIAKTAQSYILEGEIMALDLEKGGHKNFQTLMKRKRKTEIEKHAKQIPVAIYCFDILLLNEKNLMNESFTVREKALESILKKKDRIRRIEFIKTNEVSEAKAYFDKMIARGEEGVIIKSQGEGSLYKAGARDWNWIKWKKDYNHELVDTFDLVVIGAFYGKGKRSGTYGSLLCATYNHETDTFESISKLGTGLTDKMLEEIPFLLRKHEVDKKPARCNVKKEMTPDLWFEPYLVVEVIAAEITKGGLHTCSTHSVMNKSTGKKEMKGYALRFPRLIQIRADKKPEDGTYSEEIVGIANN